MLVHILTIIIKSQQLSKNIQHDNQLFFLLLAVADGKIIVFFRCSHSFVLSHFLIWQETDAVSSICSKHNNSPMIIIAACCAAVLGSE